MNDPLQNTIDAVKSLQNGGVDAIIIDRVQANETFVINLNTIDQLFQGTDAKGNPIRPGYTPFTVRTKRAKRQPSDRVTLRDTGRFYRSFEIVYGTSDFELVARDSKTARLKRKYGAEIIGLDVDSVQRVIDKIRPEVIEAAQQKLLDI